jgi:membrane protein
MVLFKVLRTLKTAGVYWAEDQASLLGAALAYYTLFSLAPLLFIAIAVAGLVYGEAATRGQVVEQVRGLIGPESAAAVQMLLENVRHASPDPWTAAVGLASLWYGALGVFTNLHGSLGRIWRLKPRSQYFLLGILKNYLLAFLMVLVSCIFVLALLTASTVGTAVWEWWRLRLPWVAWAWPLTDLATSGTLFVLLFAFTYRFLSDGQVPYRHVWGGAAVSAVLFTLGKMGIGLYLSRSLLSSAYGAAGSVVVFLVWVYYSAQIFFFGAEVIRVRLGR